MDLTAEHSADALRIYGIQSRGYFFPELGDTYP